MISSKKIFGLGSNYKFGVILGQISNLTQTMQIIYQNEALDISFSEKLVSRSSEVTRGQKSRKEGQISIFFKSRQIIPQNEARDERFSKK